MYAQSVAAAHHLGDLGKLRGHHLWYAHLQLHVVIIFLEAAYLLHVAWVVGIVVVDVHGGQFVEAINEHALAVGVDEAEGAGNLCHTLFPAPVFDSAE